MHVIFGMSALVMLVATIWMLAKDHNREWRARQLANRNKESWTAAAMLKQQSAVSQSKLDSLQRAVGGGASRPRRRRRSSISSRRVSKPKTIG